jgi:hypothetical protein
MSAPYRNDGEAADVARALGGHRNGSGWLCRCPVPSHGQGRGDRTPSLSIHDGEARLLLRCFAGCDPRDVLDELRRRGLLDEEREPTRSTSRIRLETPPPPHEPDPAAVALWQAAGPIGGTLAERFLAEHRGLHGPFPQSLRFVGSAVYPPNGHCFPAMVAAVQAADRRIVAVQLTFLGPDGDKALVSSPRWTVGTLGAGAVRFGAADKLLGLAEGTEKAIAAQLLTGIPVWSCLGAGRMHRVEIPSEVRELHIFADADEPGRAAAERTANHHQRRKVVTHLPPDGAGDWDDFLRLKNRAAA